MTKKQENEAMPPVEEAPVSKPPPISNWERLVELWADKSYTGPLAQRLRNELTQRGVTSVEMVATAPIRLVADAARAALQADAQALQAAASKLIGGKS